MEPIPARCRPGWSAKASLLADAALSAVLRTVFAILAILANMAGVGTCAGRRKHVERDLVGEKN